MTRIKRVLQQMGGGMTLEKVIERFTHSMTLANGTVLRGSAGQQHWGEFRPAVDSGAWSTWKGCEPTGWDWRFAQFDPYEFEYEEEIDYT
jgi:hypothetical protein